MSPQSNFIASAMFTEIHYVVYVWSPCRYFLTLQIKDDLLNGKLVCSDETLSQLISYMVQSEFGDFDPTEHQLDYLDSLPYLEDKSLEFKQKITQLHREKRYLLEM